MYIEIVYHFRNGNKLKRDIECYKPNQENLYLDHPKLNTLLNKSNPAFKFRVKLN